MRYLCLFLACILAGCGSTVANRNPNPPERAPLRVLSPTPPGAIWPDVCANGGLVGKSAKRLLKEIQDQATAEGVEPGLLGDIKDAAEHREKFLPFYKDSNQQHGRLYTPRQAWARVALAWAYAQEKEWEQVRDQLLLHVGPEELNNPEWSEVAFSPDLMGRTYLELIGQPAGWNDGPPDPIDGPPPELLDKVLLLLDACSQTPLTDPANDKVNRFRWFRAVLAYYAAGFPGDPNWFLCVDELEHIMTG